MRCVCRNKWDYDVSMAGVMMFMMRIFVHRMCVLEFININISFIYLIIKDSCFTIGNIHHSELNFNFRLQTPRDTEQRRLRAHRADEWMNDVICLVLHSLVRWITDLNQYKHLCLLDLLSNRFQSRLITRTRSFKLFSLIVIWNICVNRNT